MALFTGSASDYAQLQREYNKDLRGVSQWTKYFLEPLQEGYESAASAITEKANYDISSAFAAYKQQQRALQLTDKYSEGVRAGIEQQLGSSYLSNIYSTEAERQQSMSGLNENLQKALAENTKELEAKGQKLSEIEEYAISYLGYEPEQVLAGLGVNVGTSKNPLYGTGWYDIDDAGNRVMTEFGKDELSKVLLSGDFAFALREENPELYAFYEENPDMVRSLIAGTPSDVKEYSFDDKTALRVARLNVTSDPTTAFEDLYKDYNAGRITEDDLSEYIISALDEYIGDSFAPLNSQAKKEIKEWASKIKKGKSSTFNNNDRKALRAILDKYVNVSEAEADAQTAVSQLEELGMVYVPTGTSDRIKRDFDRGEPETLEDLGNILRDYGVAPPKLKDRSKDSEFKNKKNKTLKDYKDFARRRGFGI